MTKSKLLQLGGKKSVLILSLIVLLAAAVLTGWQPAQADQSLLIDKFPAVRPQKISWQLADGSVVLSLGAGTSTADVYFKFLTLLPTDLIKEQFPYADGLQPASDLYELKLDADSTSSNIDFGAARPSITIKFDSQDQIKNIYYFDQAAGQFMEVSATRDPKHDTLTFALPDTTDLIFGLFSRPSLTGTASWYVHPKYKKELMAASTDFSFGAKVKVTNLDNGKSVVVTIKDYGPDKGVFPDRVLDLGKEAFKKIASTRAGVINVSVEPLIPLVSSTNTTSTVSTSTATSTVSR